MMLQTSLGPFDLAGGPFLALYAVLLVTAIIAGEVIANRSRPDGRVRKLDHPERLAILAGGRPRFADTIVIRLLAAGALRVAGNGFAIQPGAHAQSAAERSILGLAAPLRWPRIETSLRPHAAVLERGLIADGLRLDDATAAALRFRQTLPYLLLLAFGSVKWFVGDLRDRPLGFLTALLLATALLAVIRWLRIDRRTRAGTATLADARHRRERLSRGPVNSELGEAVALFGTAVLAGSAYDSLHQLRTATSSGDGGSSDSSSSDGGGCGGGGCGGCS